jgi:membrane protease subunit HflC
MRLNFIGGVIVVLLAAALIVAYSSVFTIYQTQQALVLRLGNPQAPITTPGLHRSSIRWSISTAASSIWKRRRRK